VNERVRVIRNPKPGLVEALNLGINEASNDWIARFDVDDGYRSDRLNLQRRLITNTRAAIFCDYQFISESGKNLGIIPSPIFPEPTALSLYFSQQTPHPGVIYNKRAVTSVGGYRKRDFPAEDISLWLRLAKVGELVSVPETLLNYRLSRISVSAQNRNIAKHLTKSLVSEIGVNENNVTKCLETWRDILKSYSKLTLGEERSILFYRNLRYAMKFMELTKDQEWEITQLRLAFLSDWADYWALAKLGIDKTKRHLYR
jgi:glycosyltransferase involved in cell wall biosynthesis